MCFTIKCLMYFFLIIKKLFKFLIVKISIVIATGLSPWIKIKK
jgi:hypothetical protein